MGHVALKDWPRTTARSAENHPRNFCPVVPEKHSHRSLEIVSESPKDQLLFFGSARPALVLQTDQTPLVLLG